VTTTASARKLNAALTKREARELSRAVVSASTRVVSLEAKLGPNHLHTLICSSNLAAAYLQAGRFSEAIALFEVTLKNCESKLGPDHFVALWDRGFLATAYEVLNRWAEAESLLRDTLVRRRKSEKPDSSLVAGDLAQLGRNLLAQSRWTEAESLLRESLTICEKVLPEDWKRYNTMSLLGESLAAQGRYAEAEPMVVKGYEGMKERESRITAPDHFRLCEATVRMVHLYEAWGKLEKATEEKAELGMPDLPAEVFTRQ
jgi:tetratricopeptide (TPR) repeat protein